MRLDGRGGAEVEDRVCGSAGTRMPVPEGQGDRSEDLCVGINLTRNTEPRVLSLKAF